MNPRELKKTHAQGRQAREISVLLNDWGSSADFLNQLRAT